MSDNEEQVNEALSTGEQANEHWSEDPEVQAYLAHANEVLRPMIADSALGISIITGSRPDAKAAIELGMLLLMGKPLIITVSPGIKVPSGLAKAADEIVEVDWDDPEASRTSVNAAVERVIAGFDDAP